MNDPDMICGFDGSADGDTSLVVMHRDADGRWRVHSTDGPDATELVRLADRVFETHVPPARETISWGEWLAAHAGDTSSELTDWQRDVISRSYDRLVREGKLRHVVGGKPTGG